VADPVDKKAKRRLTDINVTNVDLVDRPANQEEFLVVKRKDGKEDPDMDPKDEKVVKDEESTVAEELTDGGGSEDAPDTDESKDDDAEDGDGSDDAGGDAKDDDAKDDDAEGDDSEGGDPVQKAVDAVERFTGALNDFLAGLEKGGKKKTEKEEDEDGQVEKADGIAKLAKMVCDEARKVRKMSDLPEPIGKALDGLIKMADDVLAAAEKAGKYPYPEPASAKKQDDEDEDGKVEKAGRILSAANIKTVKDALSGMGKALELLGGMVKQVESRYAEKAEGEDDEDKDAEAADKGETKKGMCPECGAPLFGKAVCKKCGAKIGKDGKVAKAAKADDEDDAGKAEKQDMMKCPHCGAEIEAGLDKCPECGKAIEMEKAKGKKDDDAEATDKKILKAIENLADKVEALGNRVTKAEAAVGISKSLGDDEEDGNGEKPSLWSGLGLVPGDVATERQSKD